LKLSARVIDNLTCPPGRKDRLVADDVQQGLYVRSARGPPSHFEELGIETLRPRHR
jgi:hypothetical protein